MGGDAKFRRGWMCSFDYCFQENINLIIPCSFPIRNVQDSVHGNWVWVFERMARKNARENNCTASARVPHDKCKRSGNWRRFLSLPIFKTIYWLINWCRWSQWRQELERFLVKMRFLKVVRQTCWLFPQQGKFTICSVDCACTAQCLLRFSSLHVYVG